MSRKSRWYKVRVYGTGYYEELVQATSQEEAEELFDQNGGEMTLTPTELSGTDGIEVEEATEQEVAYAKAEREVAA